MALASKPVETPTIPLHQANTINGLQDLLPRGIGQPWNFKEAIAVRMSKEEYEAIDKWPKPSLGSFFFKDNKVFIASSQYWYKLHKRPTTPHHPNGFIADEDVCEAEMKEFFYRLDGTFFVAENAPITLSDKQVSPIEAVSKADGGTLENRFSNMLGQIDEVTSDIWFQYRDKAAQSIASTEKYNEEPRSSSAICAFRHAVKDFRKLKEDTRLPLSEIDPLEKRFFALPEIFFLTYAQNAVEEVEEAIRKEVIIISSSVGDATTLIAATIKTIELAKARQVDNDKTLELEKRFQNSLPALWIVDVEISIISMENKVLRRNWEVPIAKERIKNAIKAGVSTTIIEKFQKRLRALEELGLND